MGGACCVFRRVVGQVFSVYAAVKLHRVAFLIMIRPSDEEVGSSGILWVFMMPDQPFGAL